MGGAERPAKGPTETEAFARLMRELKERAGLSYGLLARRLHTSTSTLHRYCNGEAVPAEFASVDRFARACGATGAEALSLHRAWLLADARRRSAAAVEPQAPERDRVVEPVEPQAPGVPVESGEAARPVAPGGSEAVAHAVRDRDHAPAGPTTSGVPGTPAPGRVPATDSPAEAAPGSPPAAGPVVASGGVSEPASGVLPGPFRDAAPEARRGPCPAAPPVVAATGRAVGAESVASGRVSEVLPEAVPDPPAPTVPRAAPVTVRLGEDALEPAPASGSAPGAASEPGTTGSVAAPASGSPSSFASDDAAGAEAVARRGWYRRRGVVVAAGVAAVVVVAGVLVVAGPERPSGQVPVGGAVAGAPVTSTAGAGGASAGPSAPGSVPPVGSPSASGSASASASASVSGSASAGASPPAAPSPTAPVPAVAPLKAAVRSHVWAAGCEHAYLSERGPTEVPPPPLEPDAPAWAQAQRAVHAGSQTVEVTLHGPGEGAVVLQDLQVRVTARRSPPAWNVYQMSQGCGGALTPAGFAVNLDAPRPQARPVAGNDGGDRIPAPVFPMRVSAAQPVVLRVVAAATGCDCDWYLELRWSGPAGAGTLRLDDGGRPWRTSATAGRPEYGFASELGRWAK